MESLLVEDTATNKDVVTGKTFHSKEGKQVGNIPAIPDTIVGMNGNPGWTIGDGGYSAVALTAYTDVLLRKGHGLKINDSDLAEFIGLTKDKLMSGTQACNVFGTATSDATIAQNDIPKGKIGYAKGKKIIGTAIEVLTGQSVFSIPSMITIDGIPVLRALFSSNHHMRPNSYVHVSLSDAANVVGLTANKLLRGNTVMGVSGSHIDILDYGSQLVREIKSQSSAYVIPIILFGRTPTVWENASEYPISTRDFGNVMPSYTRTNLTLQADAFCRDNNTIQSRTIGPNDWSMHQHPVSMDLWPMCTVNTNQKVSLGCWTTISALQNEDKYCGTFAAIVEGKFHGDIFKQGYTFVIMHLS